ncbi:MAG: aromatic ring-hydroxylating dioxygenase subunit alpha [Caenibius sp.]
MATPDETEQYPLPPSSVDSRLYTDPGQFERELHEVFFKSWLRACPSEDVRNPRDYLIWEQLQQSVVIARQDDGSLTAWHNVCQHRGARLVEESGKCSSARFVCPWHGFIYDLGGNLRFAPLKQEFDESRLKNMRTPPVRVEEYGGFVWICFDESLPDLRSYLADIATELDWFNLEGFDVRYRFDAVLDANWKVVVDAFNETWHVPFTHQETLSEVVQWGKAHLRICDPHSWMSIPVRGLTDRAPAGADHRASEITHYLAFPNTIYSNFPTHLQTWTMWPDGPGKTRFIAYGMVGPCPAGLSEEKWAQQNDRDWNNFRAVASEDTRIINSWGQVAHSLGQRDYLFNRAEGRLTAFHAEIDRRTRSGGATAS